MDPVHDNWERFCRHHVGDWHGVWTRYSCVGIALESFRCIRSFHVNPDASVLTHQNHYSYADGRRETKTFGLYTPSTTRSLFIDQSFSWGSPSVAVETPFFFETGFRWANQRMSCVVQYNVSGHWGPFVVIMEHLGRFADAPSTPVPACMHGDHGTRQTMPPDRHLSAPAPILWQPLEALGEHYLTCRLPEGVAVSVPRRLEPGTPFRGIVEWTVDAPMLQRGIRVYDSTGFAHFDLDIHRCSAQCARTQ
jgi:Domain of unknown function (DUF3598), N-terminal